MSSETATPQSSGPSWIGVLAANVAIVVVIALLLPAVQQAREAARRTQWRNNLKQVGLAFHNYADTHHCLPPGGIFAEDGTAYHGWVTSLSPYLDASPFYSSVDFHIPWDHPEQLGKFVNTMYPVCLDPSVPESKTINGLPQVHLAANQWLMHRNSSVALSQVSDTAQTLLAADAYGSFPPMGYPYVWRDPEIPLQTDPWQFGSSVRDITHILYADGHVGALASTVDPAVRSLLAGDARLKPSGRDVERPHELYRVPSGGYWKDVVLLRMNTQDRYDRLLLMGRETPSGEIISASLHSTSKFGFEDFRKDRSPQQPGLADAAIPVLVKYPTLRRIELDRFVSDAAVGDLVALPHLEMLTIGGEGLTDAGIHNLHGLPAVAELLLLDTRLTDAALGELAEIRSLRNLRIELADGNRFSTAAVDRFREQRPDVEFHWYAR